jgi:ligand-binding SRPBCC domain-containing protein
VSVTREGRDYVLRARQWLPRRREEVFPFFADAYNLERITPSFLNFEVLTPRPIEMREGALIDYRLRLRGIPIRWRTRIAAWEPNERFIDEQIRGPYLKWEHEHTFEESAGGVVVGDRVAYRVPGGALVNRLVVQRDVERIFRHRQRVMADLFGGSAEVAGG